MDSNIIYLSNLFTSTFKSEFSTDLLKSFLKNYIELEYLNDSFLLKSIDISNNIKKNCFHGNFDYRKYINFDIITDSPLVVFFNDDIILIENLEKNISFENFSVLNDFSLNILSLFNDENIYKNINIFHMINFLFYKKLKYFHINNDNYYNKPLYILNFFDDNFLVKNFFPRFFFKIQNCLNYNIFNYIHNFSKDVFVNTSSYMLLEKKSVVNYLSLTESGTESLNASSFYAKLYENSILNYNDHFFGGSKNKTNCYFFLLDRFAKILANFTRLLNLKSEKNVNSKVYHYGDNTFSRVYFKAVLSNFSSCKFHGLIDVDFNFFNSDSGLICKSLLLDNTSFIEMLPELAIKNNEVKCFHGATVGFIEEELFFYLMSRGLSKDESVNFLVNAFLNDILYDSSLSYFSIFNFLFNKYYKD